MERGEPFVMAEPKGVRWNEMIKKKQTRQVADEFIKEWGQGKIQSTWDVSSDELLTPGWKETVDAAGVGRVSEA